MSEIIRSHNALPLLRWLPQYNFSWMSSSAWIVIGPEEGEEVNRGYSSTGRVSLNNQSQDSETTQIILAGK